MTARQPSQRPPLTPVDDALREPAPSEERAARLDLIQKVRVALEHFQGELATATVTLQRAESEASAARADLAPLERAWTLGQPLPGDDEPALPAGTFRVSLSRSAYAPPPRLATARQRVETAEAVRRLQAEAERIAQEHVALRTGVLAQLERELAEIPPEQ